MGRLKEGAEGIISSSHCRRQNADEREKEKSPAVNLLPFFDLPKTRECSRRNHNDHYRCTHTGVTQEEPCKERNKNRLWLKI